MSQLMQEMVSQKLISALDKLPENLQVEILHYAEYLAAKYTSSQVIAQQNIHRRAGTMKGMFTMAEDFDAPLEDLKDYMES